MNFAAFVGPSYTSQAVSAACQRSVNVFPERLEAGGEPTEYTLLSVPGIEKVLTFDQGPVRTLYHQDGRVFGLGGAFFYELLWDAVTGTWSWTIRGVVTSDGNPAYIVSSGDGGQELCLCSGGLVSIFNLTTNTLTPAWAAGRKVIVTSTVASPTVIQTASAHGLTSGESVIISGHSSTPALEGTYTATVIDSTHFSVPVNVTVAASDGSTLRAETQVAANHVGFIGGYFVALNSALSMLVISGLEDGLAWDPTEYAQRSLGADRWVSMIVANGFVWLLGSETSEVWANTGASPFPFQVIDGSFIQMGTEAAYAAAVCDNAAHWLGCDKDGGRVVYRANGWAAQRISNHGIEEELRKYTVVSDAEGWSYAEGGHSFYLLSFPTEGATWVFDASTGAWHQRGYWAAGATDFSAIRQHVHCYAFGQHLVGDRVSGVVYRQSLDLTTDADGATLRALRRAPHITAGGPWVFHHRFKLDIEPGLGLATGQGSDPQAILRWSDDAGKTWSDEQWESLGRQGEYATEVEWTRLGRAKNRVYEVVITDPVPRRILGATLDLSQGTH